MKKKDLIYFLISSFIVLQTTAQDNTIKLDAQLDVESRIISIQQKINYTNTSKDTLYNIYFHNWPNSFSNRNTALAKRLLEDYDRRFHFAKKGQRGHTDIFSVQVNYNKVR